MNKLIKLFLISSIMLSGNLFAGSKEAAAKIEQDVVDKVKAKVDSISKMLDPVIANLTKYEKYSDAQWDDSAVEELEGDMDTIKAVLLKKK